MNHQRDVIPVRSRRGAALVIAIVSLALLSMTVAGVFKTIHLQRQIVQADAVRVQAEWLVQSAMNRAASQLSTSRDYSGETWDVAPQSLGQAHAAKIEISVKAGTVHARRREVAIRVEYPAEETVQARISRVVAIDIAEP